MVSTSKPSRNKRCLFFPQRGPPHFCWNQSKSFVPPGVKTVKSEMKGSYLSWLLLSIIRVLSPANDEVQVSFKREQRGSLDGP
uniref:Uncharacterized protein n=1 Tax=Anguilla anguilla TaxID=7936 RepID=A0A0E9WQ87_ANGAN